MNARLNRNLIVLPQVVLTPSIEAVAIFLDGEFKKKGQTAFLTSGFRNENQQLGIIQDFAIRYGVAKEFPEVINCRVQDTMKFDSQDPEVKIEVIYKWQRAWSKLLNIGIIVNPPKKAMCLLDYKNASGVNRKGQYINPTPHSKGTCLDIGGGDNGIQDEIDVVKPHVGTNGIIGIVLERKQNCLHVDCEKIG